MINWRKIEKEKFERLAEHLVLKAVEAENSAWVTDTVDGRGGDGGIDIDVREFRGGRIIRIYQLKYFPEGFSNGFSKVRRPQIKKSFNVAQKHDPDEWVLVVPCNLTPGERNFVEDLGSGKRVKIDLLDVTRLNSLCAQHPHIEDWAEREPLSTALKIAGRESAALNNPGDLDEEVRRLKGRVDARSPYWTFDLQTRAGQVIKTLVAQREDAAEKEPLGITMTMRFAGEDPLRAKVKDALGYGLFEPLTIAAPAITQFEQHGPEWFQEVLSGVSVVLGPVEGEGSTAQREIALVLMDMAGVTTRRAKATGVRHAVGQIGEKLRLQFAGGVEFELRRSFALDEGSPESGTSMSTDFAGLNASEAARGVVLANAIGRAAAFRVEADGVPVIRAQSTREPAAGTVVDPVLEETIRDLCKVQELSSADLTVAPMMIRPVPRRQLRIARLILEGKATVLRGNQSVGLGGVDERDNEALAKIIRGGGRLFVQRPQEEMDFLGQTISMGDVTYCLGEIVVESAEEVLRNIEDDPTGRWEAKARPKRPELGTIIYSPSRYQGGDSLEPVPWRLTGIPEHPRFREQAEA